MNAYQRKRTMKHKRLQRKVRIALATAKGALRNGNVIVASQQLDMAHRTLFDASLQVMKPADRRTYIYLMQDYDRTAQKVYSA